MSTRATIDGIGTLLRVTAPFDECLETLDKAGASRSVPFGLLARARLAVGPDHLLCKLGSFVREAVVYPAEGPALYVRESPLLDLETCRAGAKLHRKLETATEARDPIRKTGYGEIMFGDVIPMERFEQIAGAAEADRARPPAERRVFELPQRRPFKIPIDEFASHDLALWLFGDAAVAAEYRDLLKSSGWTEVPVWLHEWLNPDPSRPPFIRQLVFGSLRTDEGINGGRRLGFDDGCLSGTWGLLT